MKLFRVWFDDGSCMLIEARLPVQAGVTAQCWKLKWSETSFLVVRVDEL